MSGLLSLNQEEGKAEKWILQYFVHTLRSIPDSSDDEMIFRCASSMPLDVSFSVQESHCETLASSALRIDDACSRLRVGTTVRRIGVWKSLKELYGLASDEGKYVFSSLRSPLMSVLKVFDKCLSVHNLLKDRDISCSESTFESVISSLPFPIETALATTDFPDGVTMEAELVQLYKRHWIEMIDTHRVSPEEWALLSNILSTAFIEYNKWGWMFTESGVGEHQSKRISEQASLLKDRLSNQRIRISDQNTEPQRMFKFPLATFWRTSVCPQTVFDTAVLLDSAISAVSESRSQANAPEENTGLEKILSSIRQMMSSLLLAVLERLFFCGICSARGFVAAFITNKSPYAPVLPECLR